MYIRFSLRNLFILIITVFGALFLFGCTEKIELIELNSVGNLKVTNTESGYSVTFDEVEHASGYYFILDNNEGPIFSGTLFKDLSVGIHEIKVKAVGDNITYGDSKISAVAFRVQEKTFIKLPNISNLKVEKVNNDYEVTFDEVEHASSYYYTLGSDKGNITSPFVLNNLLEGSYEIKVKAIGDNITYSDSNEVSLSFIVEKQELIKLDNVGNLNVSLVNRKGPTKVIVTFDEVLNALKYTYTLEDQSGDIISNDELDMLPIGLYEIKVKAIGDNIIYCDSDETSVTFEIIPDEGLTGKVNLSIYAMNDFHGMIYPTNETAGISAIGDYLINRKHAGTIILSAGDMFQGTVVSSLTRGKAVVDAMNIIGFDAMTVGNHEFDWGIETILNYWDGNEENGEANFPLLAANIIDKTTNESPSWAKPYVTFIKEKIKIGVIGVIGSDQKSDILASYVENFDFSSEFYAIKKYAKVLRDEEKCDVVIVSAHTSTLMSNTLIAALSGSEKIDAILDGHTHQVYYGVTEREEKAGLAYVQSGSYGEYIGHINLVYDYDANEVVGCDAEYIDTTDNCLHTNSKIDVVLSDYQEFLDISLEELGKSGIKLDRLDGAYWASSVIATYTNSDLGIINYGGIRENAFPIALDQIVNYGDIFKISPFENKVILVELTGEEVKKLFKFNDIISKNVDKINGTINGVAIDDTKLYKVATIDFLFEKTSYPFLKGINIVDTEVIFREYLVEAFKDDAWVNDAFTGIVSKENIGKSKEDKPILDKDNTTISIYAVNDFHGMIYPDGYSVGASRLGAYLMNVDKSKSLILSAGDMFQGTAVSSMSRGEAVVDIMNIIGFNAMTIGNHEFDWGIDTILKYWDGNEENGEADFPLLAANIIDKTTGNLASWAVPYYVTIVDGVKVGVIGAIGVGEEDDILTTYVKNYQFTSELEAIKKYAKVLRETEKCDVVIVSVHNDTSSINSSIAKLTGSEKVDAVLNGHTHQAYYSTESRTSGASLPIVQSGCYGRYIGIITLEYSFKDKTVVDSDSKYISCSTSCLNESQEINTALLKYQDYINIANKELGKSGITMYQALGGQWTADVLKETFEADMGIVNKGGIRGNGFPIEVNDIITYGDIFEISPFENMVRTVKLTGKQIIDNLLGSANFISSNVNANSQTINGIKINANSYYTVATIDYLYEKDYLPFLDGIERYDTNIIFRDALAQAVIDCVEVNGKFIYPE